MPMMKSGMDALLTICSIRIRGQSVAFLCALFQDGIDLRNIPPSAEPWWLLVVQPIFSGDLAGVEMCCVTTHHAHYEYDHYPLVHLFYSTTKNHKKRS